MRAVSDPELSLLFALGLDEAQRQAFEALADPELSLFRVTVEAQAQLALLAPGEIAPSGGVRWGELSGRLRSRQASDPAARPTVGDFVVARSGTDPLRVEHVLPRRTQFVRQSARKRTEPQTIAANVDQVWVVTSPNDDFSPRRIERYLATIHAAGAKPGILLNKADLVDDPSPFVEAAEEVALDAPVVLTSARTGTGIDALEDFLGAGRTVALVGSSGVGKSSLTNVLLGSERQRVEAIRVGDDKGRHTTTHRELFVLPRRPNGADRGLLIDTPGMRALALWTKPNALLEAFADIAELAEACRFRDCRHEREPDCAVRSAAEAGRLSPGRLQSFLRLEREARSQPRVDGRPRRRGRV